MVSWKNTISSYSADEISAATPIYMAPEVNFDAWLEENAIDYLLLAKANNFKGKAGSVLIASDAVFVGVGQGDDPFCLGAASSKLTNGLYYLKSSLSVEEASLYSLAWGLGCYSFTKYVSDKDLPTLMLPENADEAEISRNLKAVWLARDLVNTPTEDMGPAHLTDAVKAVASNYKAQVKVIEGDALLKQNFPLVHAVGRAAARPPRLIDLQWGAKDAPKITLVGKGVCFDTGGLNIKLGANMKLMKKDMGGSANALALAQMIMEAGLNVRLRLIIPAVENAIDGQAYRPGDVFDSRKGISVEISNTDAEGRLVLADGLALASEEKPDHILCFATLTGAARVALGPDLAPMYSTDDEFAASIEEQAERVSDPVWRMPFWDRYNRYLKSNIADVNHAAETPFAGSMTAALFLKRFVDEDIPFTHFDIFAWNPTTRPGRPEGGEAFAIRAVFEALRAKYQQ